MLSLEPVALALVALPGAVAAVLLLDIRTRLRVRTRRAASWQRGVDERLSSLEGAVRRLPVHPEVAVPGDVERAVDAITERIQAAENALERPPVRAGAATHEDLIGTVRVIQAQYEGRLDRAQASLDEAVRALRAELEESATGRGEVG